MVSHREHQVRAEREVGVGIACAVITISDTRTSADDRSGATLCAALSAAGHRIAHYAIVKDEATQIADMIRQCAATGCTVIVTNGGTGIARRDSTFEAIDALLEKRLPGFGEIFRMLSYQEIGSAAMLSRATAGVYGRSLIFCLPGSPGAVALAIEKLIVPELTHLVWETIRQ